MAAMMAGLRPSTSGVSFTARPALRTPASRGGRASADAALGKSKKKLDYLPLDENTGICIHISN